MFGVSCFGLLGARFKEIRTKPVAHYRKPVYTQATNKRQECSRMKLVEILARELDEWPEGYSRVVQNPKGNEGWCLFLDDEQVSFDESQWDYVSFDMRIYKKTLDAELAADHETAIVTRADWEAERAKLKADQAVDSLAEERAKLKAPKANADGWIRHRGGKCSVEAGTLVDVRYRDGEIRYKVAALINLDAAQENWIHEDDKSSPEAACDIMSYRIHKPAEQLESQFADGHPGLKTISSSFEKEPGVRIALHNPLEWRDRIRELDAQRAEVESTYQRQISEITQERELLVQRLAGEGLALVEVVVDWRKWKKGDVVMCVSQNHKWSDKAELGASYRLSENPTMDDEHGLNVWVAGFYMNPADFKFVSRPAS